MYKLTVEEETIKETQEEEKINLLSSNDIKGISEYILNGAKNIIVMTGAGVSVSAGIPDFRTPGTGIYSKLEEYDLPCPEAIFSIDYFKENPEPFYTFAKEIYPGLHCPTPAHYFIKLLADKNILQRVYTQNIDSLEHIAEIDKSLIVAAHGNFDTATCIETGEKIDPEEVKEYILSGKEGWEEMNEKYGGLVKPDIVFFGEQLPTIFHKLLEEDFPKCDLLIVMGTSLKVRPFCSLIDYVPKNIPRLLINREEVGVKEDNELSFMIQQMEGFKFEDECGDVSLLTDCDKGVRELADELGWLNELEELISTGKNKLGNKE